LVENKVFAAFYFYAFKKLYFVLIVSTHISMRSFICSKSAV